MTNVSMINNFNSCIRFRETFIFGFILIVMIILNTVKYLTDIAMTEKSNISTKQNSPYFFRFQIIFRKKTLAPGSIRD